MKANHNSEYKLLYNAPVVLNISKSKNESKSQLALSDNNVFVVVLNISKSKNESKSHLAIIDHNVYVLILNNSKSKNENKSQPFRIPSAKQNGCSKYQ